MNDRELVHEAYLEALKGFNEGGLPIGSVLADAAGRIVSRGHNLRVQTGEPDGPRRGRLACAPPDGAATGPS